VLFIVSAMDAAETVLCFSLRTACWRCYCHIVVANCSVPRRRWQLASFLSGRCNRWIRFHGNRWTPCGGERAGVPAGRRRPVVALQQDDAAGGTLPGTSMAPSRRCHGHAARRTTTSSVLVMAMLIAHLRQVSLGAPYYDVVYSRRLVGYTQTDTVNTPVYN